MPSNLGVVAKAHAQPQKIGDYQAGELTNSIRFICSYLMMLNKKLRTGL